MQARMRNAMRAMVAAAVMTMSATSLAGAVQTESSLPRDTRVVSRVVSQYYESAWLTPMAVVLDSKQAWDEWSQRAVDNGWAMAVEPAPEGVDWKREVVMVVALGEDVTARRSVSVTAARKHGQVTEVTLDYDTTQGGSSPSVVVALPRSTAHGVALVANLTMPNMPQRAEWVTTGTTGGGVAPAPVAMSWGALKANYR